MRDCDWQIGTCALRSGCFSTSAVVSEWMTDSGSYWKKEKKNANAVIDVRKLLWGDNRERPRSPPSTAAPQSERKG